MENSCEKADRKKEGKKWEKSEKNKQTPDRQSLLCRKNGKTLLTEIARVNITWQQNGSPVRQGDRERPRHGQSAASVREEKQRWFFGTQKNQRRFPWCCACCLTWAILLFAETAKSLVGRTFWRRPVCKYSHYFSLRLFQVVCCETWNEKTTHTQKKLLWVTSRLMEQVLTIFIGIGWGELARATLPLNTTPV